MKTNQKYALVIDVEDLVDTYFKVKYGAEVAFDGEYLNKGRDYAELVIPHYEILSDPEGGASAMHEVILEEDTSEDS